MSWVAVFFVGIFVGGMVGFFIAVFCMAARQCEWEGLDAHDRRREGRER